MTNQNQFAPQPTLNPIYEKLGGQIVNSRRPMEEAVTRLETSIGTVAAELEILFKRLEPITSSLPPPPPTHKDPSTAPHDGSSPATVQLCRLNDQLCSLIDKIRLATDRLEV